MEMLFALTLGSAIGSGLVGGLLFAFSVAVMKALSELPPSGGIAAMQSINAVILNPVFLAVFLGTAAISVVAGIVAIARWNAPGSTWLLAGGLLYFGGTFLVTILINVPMNNAPATWTSDDPRAAAYWKFYLSRWTAWNHVRTASSPAATAAFIFAIRGAAGNS